MQLPDSPIELGLVTIRQAMAPRDEGGLGLTERAVRWRVESGRWQRLHRGVFVMRSGPIGWLTAAAAALLAYGRDAALCGASAGVLHDLVPVPAAAGRGLMTWTMPGTWAGAVGRNQAPPIEVLVPPLRHPRVHRGTTVRSGSTPVLDHWPRRTTFEATVIDLASSGSADDLAALLAKALGSSRTTAVRLRAELARRRRHPRRSLVKDMLTETEAGSESPLEVRFVRDVLRRHGLPTGTAQASVTLAEPADRRRFDRVIRAQRVTFELDGALYHDGSRRVADRRKTNDAIRQGWLLPRYGWTESAGTPCQTAIEVAECLTQRGWTGTARSCGPGCAITAALGNTG